MTRYIGLGHYRRTGKDTLCKYLMEAGWGVRVMMSRRAFADEVKRVAHDLYWWAGLQGARYYDDPAHEHEREVVLPELGKSPRQIWIDLGTPAIREQVYADTWVRLLLERTRGRLGTVVIPDVRFPNEVKALRDCGATLVKVVRPGFEPGPDVADQALVGYDGWDHVVGHSGTLDELREFAAELIDRIVYHTTEIPLIG